MSKKRSYGKLKSKRIKKGGGATGVSVRDLRGFKAASKRVVKQAKSNRAKAKAALIAKSRAIKKQSMVEDTAKNEGGKDPLSAINEQYDKLADQNQRFEARLDINTKNPVDDNRRGVRRFFGISFSLVGDWSAGFYLMYAQYEDGQQRSLPEVFGAFEQCRDYYGDRLEVVYDVYDFINEHGYLE